MGLKSGHSRTPGQSGINTQEKKERKEGSLGTREHSRRNSENPYEEQTKNSDMESQNDKVETVVSQKEQIIEQVAREDTLEDKDYHYKNVASIWDGKIFGELALISHKPRAATIQSITECHFATLDRRSFQIIQSNHEKALNKRIEIIKNVPCFDSLSRVALMKY